MSAADDRRAPGAARAPFDGLVEVGGTLGPSFEAQAVNVSEEGMKLRTAYLPELGQQVTCRFEAGAGQTVTASGDVVWSRAGDTGGEFGIRFTDIDPDSVEPLKRACGVAVPVAGGKPGAKVRLYIDGLASPMRAKIRESHPGAITVGSDLGFLQVGKHLELEDAQSGTKRPASIDRVDVAVEPSSHIPQLVVTLRYDDAPAESGHDGPSRASSTATYPSGDPASMDDAPLRMKSAFSRQAARVGPALLRVAQRAKVAAMLLMARGRTGDEAPRRTTAPPPGGGLHSSGRRVVRGEPGALTPEDADAAQPKRVATKRKMAMVAGVLATAVVSAVAIKQAHHDAAPAPSTTAAAVETASTPSSSLAVATNATPVAAPVLTQTPASVSPAAADESDESSHGASHNKHRPTPFANGPVHHGNVLHLKMDGPVETIEGAQQPTGFTVKIPGRKSLEAAAPLAARDSRIAAIKVSNEPSGAELNVTFKDGVPNYHVSARGDALVIALAPPGALETTTAKRDDKGSKTPKRSTRERDTTPER
jgi:hypothetical protein